MDKTIARFNASTDEDLRWRVTFLGTDFADRVLVVYVRERGSNAQKVKLTLGSGLTRIALADRVHLDARVARLAMASWARTEYETDITDETTGATRLVAVRVVYDDPGKLPGGVSGNQATVALVNNQAVVTAVGGVGLPGPSTNIEIGDVNTLEAGEPAAANMRGSAPDLILDLDLPKGDTGHRGWGPIFGVVSDGSRRVFVLAGWAGGGGTPPPITDDGDPLYLGPAGLTTVIANAAEVRGLKGDQGDKGWSPVLAMVPDGARRVLQVQSWTGGAGTPPTSGAYLGPAGFVADIADATDFRGVPGAAVGPGSIDTPELANEAVTEEKIDADFVATLATMDDLENYVFKDAGGAFLPARITSGRGDPTAGKIAFNITTGEYEGGNGTEWVPIGGGGAIPGTTFPTANLRDGLIFWHKTWLAPFIYHIDANGGHWVSMFPVIDPSAFVLKGAAQADLGFSAYMWGLRAAADAAAARAALVVPWELIEQKVPANGDSTIDFTTLPAGFDRFYLEIDGIGVQTDDASLALRVRTGPSTWETTAYSYIGVQGASAVSSSADSFTAGIALMPLGASNRVGNAAGEGFSCRADFNAKDTASFRRIRVATDITRPDGVAIGGNLGGQWGGTTAITGIRLYSPSGSLLKGQGNAKLMGFRA